MFEVEVRSYNDYQELEWTESFKSKSFPGACWKASRWLRKQGFKVSRKIYIPTRAYPTMGIWLLGNWRIGDAS